MTPKKKVKRTRSRKPTAATEWPIDRPLPKFRDREEEDRFWAEHSVGAVMEARGERLVYVPQATRRPRTHVYRLRLDDAEMAILQGMAQRRGVTVSVVLRDMVRRHAIAE